MSAILGILGVNDSDRVFLKTIGQDVVYDAIKQTLALYNEDLQKTLGVFLDKRTWLHKERYRLAGGGRLQKVSTIGRPAEVKAYGSWDVCYPLEGFAAALGGGRVDMAYMTAQDLDRHLDTVMIQDVNTVRFEVLRRMFNDTQRTFGDERWGSLTVEGFANGDSVVYPPVLGSETEATDDHYYFTGYIESAISNTNNPFATVRDELQEHFGTPEGGGNMCAFINPSARSYSEALTLFEEVNDRFIRPGDDKAVPFGLPKVPGELIGRLNGCWVSVWRFIPTGYILAVDLDSPKPIVMREDPPDTGLPSGLALVAKNMDHPLEESYWEHRFGIGVGNRLNGVFLQFHASAFSIPTGYTF